MTLPSTFFAQSDSTSYTLNTNAIPANTTVSIGVSAGTDASQSTFIGNQAGKDFQASKNIFIGYRSGAFITSPEPLNNFSNVGFGPEAGSYSTGIFRNNLLLGVRSGYTMTNSYDNVMLGGVAGAYSEGYSNSFVGGNSGTSSTGNENVFFGYRCGEGSTSNSNISIGARSGNSSNGNENLFLGFKAGSHYTGDNNIIIGIGNGSSQQQRTGIQYSCLPCGS